MSKREEMLLEMHTLLMRMNCENGLCAEDQQRFENLKSALLGGGCCERY